ncbi:MAG: hypothetical protein P8Y47_08305 [Alphaproteobacteria bacterium]
MAVPWWVYLIIVVTIGFFVAIHFAPVFLARLEAQDKKRREEVMARRERESSGEND